MSDLDLTLVPQQELSMDMFDPDQLKPDVETTEKPRMPRVSIVQATSTDAITAGAVPGDYILDWKDPTRPAQFFKSLRVYLIDVVPGRVMFPFKPDGKPDRAKKEPWCASSDGDHPRNSEMFSYVGKNYIDWRTKEEVIIGTECAKCPLGKFITYKDENGQKQNQPPPCQQSPQFVLWLIDQNHPAIFQSSAPTVRNRLVGQPRKGYPGINKFFQPNGVDMETGKNTYPNIEKGQWFSVKLTAKMETHNSGNQTYVPIVELDTVPLEVKHVKAVFDSKGLYKADNMREVLSGLIYENENGDYESADGSPKERLTPPGMDGAAKLGSGKNRRIGKNKDSEVSKGDGEEVAAENEIVDPF